MKVLALALLLYLCTCGSVAHPASPPSPSPPSVADLQYRLVDTVGTPVSCPGPIIRTDPADVARMVAALRARNPAEFDAIVRREHLNPASLSRADNLLVIGQDRVLSAVALTPQGSRYGFGYELAGRPTIDVTGTIDPAGAISVTSRMPAPPRLCPL